MQNVQLLGVQHMDRFNMRACFVVVGTFGIITLVSYVNELAKSGLLFGGPHSRVPGSFRWVDGVDGVGHAHVLMQKTGDRHKLDLNIIPLESLANSSLEGIKGRSQKVGNDEKDNEIQIHLHLDKQDDYTTSNKTEVQIYNFRNVMPNFFITINQTVAHLSDIRNITTLNKATRKNISQEYRTFTDYLHQQLTEYQNHTKVMFYQHDQGGYASRDCFVHLAVSNQLVTGRAPLSANYRSNWESMPRVEQQQFEALYGGLSFGACESLDRPCSYFAVVSHPLDRLLQVYSICKGNANRTMCKFLRVDNTANIMQFLKLHGSSMFQKLLYYSRHCRLVGNNEICINDNNAYFVLTPQEKRTYLDNILQNLENWFSVVGVLEEQTMSLKMFDSVIGLDFMKCLSMSPSDIITTKELSEIFHKFHFFRHSQQLKRDKSKLYIDNVPYLDLRDQLQNSNLVRQWLHADLKIYEKILEIFNKQKKIFGEMLGKLKGFYYPKNHIIPPNRRSKSAFKNSHRPGSRLRNLNTKKQSVIQKPHSAKLDRRDGNVTIRNNDDHPLNVPTNVHNATELKDMAASDNVFQQGQIQLSASPQVSIPSQLGSGYMAFARTKKTKVKTHHKGRNRHHNFKDENNITKKKKVPTATLR